MSYFDPRCRCARRATRSLSVLCEQHLILDYHHLKGSRRILIYIPFVEQVVKICIMVHVRLNERETNPNPHINFITALPSVEPADAEGARQLLRALAAQVRPVMKAHGFEVNSLEEVSTQVVSGEYGLPDVGW